jgi:hypothetical protein
MMNFRTLKANIVTLLADNANGNFQVVQAQRQKEGAEDINLLRKVAVYFATNDLSENKGTTNGELVTKPTYHIELKVAEKGTLTDITDPTTITSAEIIADDALDELFENVLQIIMDARNIDLELPVGTISNRYIKSLIKGSPNQHGEFVVLVGRMDLDCNLAESILGDEGVEGTNIDSTLEINGDGTQATGINEPQTE